jgi:DNA-directed RNA polymerase subunit N (RpoN/RPB10)
MLYMVCPTCGFFIGKKTLEYEKEKEKICSDPELSDEEKEIKISEVILKLNITRYCCKMRLMSYKDIVTIVAPST